MLAPRPLVGALLCATAPLATAQSEVEGSLTVTQLGSSVAGYTTYQVSVDFGRTTADVYALFGEEGDPMIIPAGFQVPAPATAFRWSIFLKKQIFPICSGQFSRNFI